MVYTRGKLKGQLTTAEIRKLISAHNKLSKITIPPRSTRDTIMKIISKAGFRVNHGEEKLEQTKATKKDISLEKAKDVTKRIPKTEEQKKKATARKQEKQVQKEKELKLAKKEGVKEFKQKKAEAQKKKPEPKKKAKGVTMGTQTDEEPKPKKEEKKETLQLEDKKKDEKPVKTEKSFKVERTERSKMINQLSSETGKKFNPFKILGITAREETPELVKKKCRELRLKNHPDKGGDKDKFDMIQKACDILLKTQTILKKKGNDKDKGEAVKKPDEKKVGTFKMKGKEYDFTSFLEWTKNQGYKWSNSQMKAFKELLEYKKRRLVSVRTYNKSNGQLVIVPTFKIIDKDGVEKEAELTNLTTQSIFKTELKPAVKKDYTPEEKKEFLKSQILFFKKDTAELERLKKSDEKLEDDEYKKIKSLETDTPNFGFYIVDQSEPSIYDEKLSQKQKNYIKNNMDLYNRMSERHKRWRERIKSNNNVIKRLEKQLEKMD